MSAFQVTSEVLLSFSLRKKIDSAKMFGFLASGCLLLITLLGDPAEACICVPNHPQNDYCSADVGESIYLGEVFELLSYPHGAQQTHLSL